MLAFAGIWTNWTCGRKAKECEITAEVYGFLTCQPNVEIGKVPKAIVILNPAERSMMPRCAHRGTKRRRCKGHCRTDRSGSSRPVTSRTASWGELRRRFDDPLTMPDRRPNHPHHWRGGGICDQSAAQARQHRAVAACGKGATRGSGAGDPFVFITRIVFCKALSGEKPPPIGKARRAIGREAKVTRDQLSLPLW